MMNSHGTELPEKIKSFHDDQEMTRCEKRMQNREVNIFLLSSYVGVRRNCNEQPVGKKSDAVKGMQRYCT
jgi:hypothetical protein